MNPEPSDNTVEVGTECFDLADDRGGEDEQIGVARRGSQLGARSWAGVQTMLVVGPTVARRGIGF